MVIKVFHQFDVDVHDQETWLSLGGRKGANALHGVAGGLAGTGFAFGVGVQDAFTTAVDGLAGLRVPVAAQGKPTVRGAFQPVNGVEGQPTIGVVPILNLGVGVVGIDMGADDEKELLPIPLLQYAIDSRDDVETKLRNLYASPDAYHAMLANQTRKEHKTVGFSI